ncbi:O-antigen polymerase [Microbacterium testaceum]|uniref:O-antigen polymerase n=1 Tax=Microbacterium testaceum TaxID=2033 RepID=UPI003EBEFDE4
MAFLGRNFHPLSLYAVFTYSHIALFVIRPAYNGIFQNAIDPFGAGQHNSTLILAAVIAALGFITVSLLYGMLKHPGRPNFTISPLSSGAWRTAAPGVVIVILAGVALYSVYVRQLGGIDRLLAVSSGRSVELTQALASSSGYFTSGLLFTFGASVLIYCHGLKSGRKRLAILGVALLAVGTGPQLLAGSRSVFLPLAVTLLVCFVWIFPGRIKPVYVAVAALPAFLLFFIIPRLLRQMPTDAPGSGFFSQLAPDQVLDGFFGGLDTAMIDAFAHQVAEQGSGQLPLANGSTYVGALGAAIPRAWWTDKPQTVDTLLNQALFPDTASRSIGFSFGVYSEPYLNFGFFGVVLFCAFLGVAFAIVDNLMMNNLSVFGLSLCALVVGSLFPIVRGSLTFDSQRLLIPAIPIILIYIGVQVFYTGQKERQLRNIDSRASGTAQSLRYSAR